MAKIADTLGKLFTKSTGQPIATGIEKAAVKAPNPVGVVGIREVAGRVDEEFLYDLRWPEAGAIYQEMASNDAVVGACLYLLETLIRGVRWKAVAPDTTVTADNVLFLQQCMDDMEDTWDDFICEVLSMLTYGFSFHEISYKVRRGPLEKNPCFYSQYSDGKIGWRAMPVRSQTTLDSWLFDPTGRPTHFVQDPSLVGAQAPKVDIPLAGNLLFKTKSSRGNPEGVSLLRRCYRAWYFKRYIEELEGIGIERSLAGIPVLQPDEQTPLFDRNNKEMISLLGWATQVVTDLRKDANHGLVLPNGWSLKLLGPEGKGGMDTNKIIERHDSRIAMSLLSDLLMLGEGSAGSFALSETKQDILLRSVSAIINSICKTLNTCAVPKLFLLNGMQLDRYPEITTDTLKPPTLKEVALLLRSAGLDITSNLELYNTFMRLLNAPVASSDENMASTLGAGNSDMQDSVDGDAKMSDMSYT